MQVDHVETNQRQYGEGGDSFIVKKGIKSRQQLKGTVELRVVFYFLIR